MVNAVPRFRRRYAVVAAVVFTGVLTGSPAYAFTYPEHFVITREAWRLAAAVDGQATQAGLSALQEFVQPAGTRSWPIDIDVSPTDAVPKETFHVADLVALAADHAATPQDLLNRWFWFYDSGSKCSVRNAIDAVFALDNSAEPPTVCTSGPTSKRFGVDRKRFITDVRGYHNATTVLKSTDDIDPMLASHDCAYICMAERGRTHFRIPTLTTEDASYRHDYPNGALAYSMNHAIALGLAMMSNSEKRTEPRPYLGLALVFEAFALHYLQDGIAPGHIVSSHYGYGNITVSGTHDKYNKEGIAASLPEALCKRLKAFQDAGNLGGEFTRLTLQCAKPIEKRSPILHGDHAIANKLVGNCDDVTLDVAEILSMTSILEVVRAATSHAWLDGPGSQFGDFLNDRMRTTLAGRPVLKEGLAGEALSEAAQKAPAPAAGLAAPGTPAPIEQSLVKPTKTPESSSTQLTMLLRSQRAFFATRQDPVKGEPPPPLRLGAAELWPSPTVPVRLNEAPGGNNLLIPLLVRTASVPKNSDLIASIGLGWAYMATLYGNRIIFDVSGFGTYASAQVRSAVSRLGGGGQVGLYLHWLRYRGVSFLNGLHFAGEAISRTTVLSDERHAFQFTARFSPISYETSSDLKSYHIGPVVGAGAISGAAGRDGEALVFFGLAVDATYHWPRTASPLPEDP